MKIYILNETNDNRVAITPDIAQKMISSGQEVYVEKGAGVLAGYADKEYAENGSIIFNDRSEITNANVIFSINKIEDDILSKLTPKTYIISGEQNNNKMCKKYGIISFALNKIPRTTRAQYMDILSSQSSLAGYKAMIEASHVLNRAIPLMMTTAGTIPSAKVLVIGAGVAGLQAIATARRLGANVSAYDVRASTKEQVESLGAKFVNVVSEEKTDGVYAKEMSDKYRKAQENSLRNVLPTQDIVITTAQIPGKKAPILISNDMIGIMKKGSVIIDLAAKTGGNCELTKVNKKVVKNGITVIGFDNILNLIPYDASRLYAKNLLSFFELFLDKLAQQPDISKIDDDIIKATLEVL